MSTFRRILNYLLAYKLLIAIAILCSVMYTAMYGLSLYLVGPFLERLFQTDSTLLSGRQKP